MNKDNKLLLNPFENKQLFIANSISHHTGKMENIPSINTSVFENTFCATRRTVSGSICSKCYACKYLSLRPQLREKCAINHKFFTTVELTDADIPKFNALFFRFESFGELQNVLQFKNYVTIARNNYSTKFLLWTKNLDIVADFIEQYPNELWTDNFNIIASSRFINHSDYDYYSKYYDGLFVGVFTAYTKDYAAQRNININCAYSKCWTCDCCCYELTDTLHPVEINEIVK